MNNTFHSEMREILQCMPQSLNDFSLRSGWSRVLWAGITCKLYRAQIRGIVAVDIHSEQVLKVN